MYTSVVGYPDSVNLGDWIQSLIIFYIWPDIEFQSIDREHLHVYSGPETKLICNGWFIQNPNHWPPADSIHPLFISFHINPTAQKQLTNTESLIYYRKYEPIGCRDHYTMEILKEHGIKTYFSGCLTLLYKKSYLFKNSPPEASGVLVTDPFDRLKPSVVFSYNPVVLLRQILKYPIKLLFYKLAMKRLSNALSKSILPIQYISQIIDNQTLNNYDSKKLAEDYVRKIASAKVVITSRIHTALPATAMGVPVIFLNDGLNHINHKSRLSGLLNYFEICSSKDLKNIDIQRIKPKNNHLGLSERLKSTIDTFLEIS